MDGGFADAAFDRLVGLEYGEASSERIVGRVTIRDELRGSGGAVHGGVYSSISETLASLGTWLGVAADGMMATGMTNDTTVVDDAREGTLNAVAVRRHAGDESWLWDVEIRDGDGRLCATTVMVVAVRPFRPAVP